MSFFRCGFQKINLFRIFILLSFILLVAFISPNGSMNPLMQKKADSINKLVERLYTPEYLSFKKKVITKFKDEKPGLFGPFIPGVEPIKPSEKEKKRLAFTFDACSGNRTGYNAALIDFLRKEKIHATLFVTGTWINAHLKIFKELAADTLFEIENHGLYHRVCSINGLTMYGIMATRNAGEVIDEIELNARRIKKITGLRPKFFRSSTTYVDEASCKIAHELGMKVISYDILSGDAVPFTPAEEIKNNIMKGARGGAIVIMHFNHPKWFEKQALELAIPELRKKAYSFVKLNQVR